MPPTDVPGVPNTLESVISAAAAWAAQHRDAAALREALRERGCYVYGAGGFGREVAEVARGQGFGVQGFVDRFADGRPVAGLPCYRPDQVDTAAAARAVLIVAVNNFKTPVGDIVWWAREVPFAEIIHVAELPDVLDPVLGHYWQGPRRLIADNSVALARLEAMLGDDRSRGILAELTRYRITARPEDHPSVDRERQYFPEDLPLAQTEISVVDCGAFPGDMLGAVEAAGHRLRNWYAFEPDPANFAHLGRVTAEAGGFASASLFPCGVGDSTGLVRFSDGAADASRAMDAGDGEGGVMVPIVRVGDVVHAERIDMVKLDVEGFEAAAIDGMVQLLARHRPRLAVAIYHRPADLWEIAFKINALFPGARYAIRQHGYNGYDTVLYADL